MSVINKALSEMTDKATKTNKPIERVDVAPVASGINRMVWLGVGVCISLGVGAWAMTQQADVVMVEPVVEDQPVTTVVALQNDQQLKPLTPATPKVASEMVAVDKAAVKEQPKPVAKLVTMAEVSTPEAPQIPPVVKSVEKTIAKEPVKATTTSQVKVVPAQVESKPKVTAPAAKKSLPEPIKVAAVTTSTPKTTQVTPIKSGELDIKQVELSHEQLAQKAISRAKKSIDANNYTQAIKEYRSALKYTPRDENVRKRLAALYYGRGDVRRAGETLKQGIELNPESESLRLALVNILVKQDLPLVALGVLEDLPNQPSIDYLAARAGLAQKAKKSAIAMESYQLLSKQDADNAKWWLGLAIEQERAKQLDQALDSYNKALNRLGLSSQTHTFIKSRLNIIKEQLEAADAN
ncbi:tetratricopeptide repeat protein [Vibrio sp. SCSIO 43136]|uniref:tetratricopeptide repeat protein n=1 Tax=Vibrio sp. SCSIO 43136 TaxID=2819101 RepID=UPI0020754735|nr:tetratricopeptide repeat protein [Vibrio sp. SCSIO 43136]USD65021.1 tetratricopeptide repeat protein [Vibrio sp. SCSIO 43136]